MDFVQMRRENSLLFRWGGRTHTLEVEGGMVESGKVEMGANWIHGGRSLTVVLSVNDIV